MKLTHAFLGLCLAASLCVGNTYAAEKAAPKQTCCEKAKADGKKCTHKCCVNADRGGKACEKCNPPGTAKAKK